MPLESILGALIIYHFFIIAYIPIFSHETVTAPQAVIIVAISIASAVIGGCLFSAVSAPTETTVNSLSILLMLSFSISVLVAVVALLQMLSYKQFILSYIIILGLSYVGGMAAIGATIKHLDYMKNMTLNEVLPPLKLEK